MHIACRDIGWLSIEHQLSFSVGANTRVQPGAEDSSRQLSPLGTPATGIPAHRSVLIPRSNLFRTSDGSPLSGRALFGSHRPAIAPGSSIGHKPRTPGDRTGSHGRVPRLWQRPPAVAACPRGCRSRTIGRAASEAQVQRLQNAVRTGRDPLTPGGHGSLEPSTGIGTLKRHSSTRERCGTRVQCVLPTPMRRRGPASAFAHPRRGSLRTEYRLRPSDLTALRSRTELPNPQPELLIV